MTVYLQPNTRHFSLRLRWFGNVIAFSRALRGWPNEAPIIAPRCGKPGTGARNSAARWNASNAGGMHAYTSQLPRFRLHNLTFQQRHTYRKFKWCRKLNIRRPHFVFIVFRIRMLSRGMHCSIVVFLFAKVTRWSIYLIIFSSSYFFVIL